MAQKEKADAPLQIRNLTELKRCIQPGTEIKVLSHSKHPALPDQERHCDHALQADQHHLPG